MKWLPLALLIPLAAIADPTAGSKTSVKLCDPASGHCANLSTVSGSQAVKVDVVQSVAPSVTGTVTANQGTAGASAWLVTYSSAPHVIVDTAPSTAVTGTFWQTTQPVSIASMPSTPVTGTFWQATQPVSNAAAAVTFLNAVTTTGQSGSGTIGGASLANPSSTSYTVHILAYYTSGSPTSVAVQLEGSEDNAHWHLISTVGTATIGVLGAGGYWPYLRANLTAFSGGSSPTMTATYLGAASSASGIVDAGGRQIVVGPDLAGAAPTGNPVRIAGTTGSTLVAPLYDGSGNAFLVSSKNNGQARPTYGDVISGTDSSNNAEMLRVDNDGNAKVVQPFPWNCTAVANLTLAQCQAAFSASEKLMLTDIIVQTTTGTAGSWQLKYGTGTNCGTGTTALTGWLAPAPISTAQPQAFHLHTPLAAPLNNAICVVGSSNTDTVNITLAGFVAPGS